MSVPPVRRALAGLGALSQIPGEGAVEEGVEEGVELEEGGALFVFEGAGFGDAGGEFASQW